MVGFMKLDIYASMAKGVHGAACVVCCMSQAYQDSVRTLHCCRPPTVLPLPHVAGLSRLGAHAALLQAPHCPAPSPCRSPIKTRRARCIARGLLHLDRIPPPPPLHTPTHTRARANGMGTGEGVKGEVPVPGWQ
jgi:hypothetical protein